MRRPPTGCNDTQRSHRRIKRLTYVLVLCLIAATSVVLRYQPTGAQEQEPIVTTGHGGFFGPDGRQIPVTISFVTRAQKWYRDRLLSRLTQDKKREFADYERRLLVGLNTNPQEKLIVQHQSIEWLLTNTESSDLKLQIAAKVRALRSAMNRKLPEQADLKVVERSEPFALRPEIKQRLQSMRLNVIQHHAATVTTNSGQAYIDECSAAGVPIPPRINLMDPAGLAGWKSQGFIPQAEQFIVGTPAELRSFRSTSPEGMCYALPRYTDATLSTVMLDGVICMGKVSSKVCFWDNQWINPDTGVIDDFEFPAGTQIPIGVPDAPGGKYQAGGKEIEFGPGAVCTDCHAGENPYIIHPQSNLAPSGPPKLWESLSVAPENLPSIPNNRYDPIVAATWPQNQFSQAFSTVPGACRACHVKNPAGPGRFPHLSNKLPGYCSMILPQAINETMPPGDAGSVSTEANAFRNMWCNSPPDSSSADAGDPHLTTVNKVAYDFQSAGEFVMLRDYEEFEVQVRKAPIATTFFPGPDPHDGIATCPSLNTAVAARVGNRRVTYQPNLSGVPDPSGLQLRVDGVLRTLGPTGIDLGQGGRIVSVPAPRGGGIRVDFPNGAHMFVIPNFWVDQGYWYMNVDVTKTRAVEGVLGFIRPGDWLPALPNGTSMGPLPASLHQRYINLYQTFANAWRVTNATSLFDYAPGTTTETFTFPTWPLENPPCTLAGLKPAKPASRRVAEAACKTIVDKNRRANCIFDVMITGETGFADTYLATEKIVPVTGTGGGTGGQGGTTTSGRLAAFADFGANFPHGSFSNVFNTGFSLNAGLEYMFTPNFSGVGTFGYHRFNFVIPSASTNVYQISGNMKAYFTTPPNKFRPFVNGGVGAYVFSSATTRFGGNVGAGVLYEITPKFGVQGSYNQHIVNTSGTFRFSTVQGGVRYVF